MRVLLPLLVLLCVAHGFAQQPADRANRPSESSGVTMRHVPVDPATDGQDCIAKFRFEASGDGRGREVVLNWKAKTGATGYIVERSTNEKDYAKDAELPATATSYKLPPLAPGTHWYRVKASYAVGGR